MGLLRRFRSTVPISLLLIIYKLPSSKYTGELYAANLQENTHAEVRFEIKLL